MDKEIGELADPVTGLCERKNFLINNWFLFSK
ncbi:uncharacterized protein METZ01_LOCUS430301 [marine metagenome]|uniref:Uncharacterized protein n=1 Tax=marine metagenome TaxID=408172 RepID=A0A382Y271_9ZZZZ